MMTCSLAQVVETLKTQGAVTVEGVFSSREMAAFRALVDRTIEEASLVETYKGRPTNVLLGRQNGTIWNVWEFYAVCEGALRYTRHPAILRVLETTLGESVIHASIGTLFDKVAGGGGEVGWHQDTFFILVPPAGKTLDPTNYWHQFGRFHVRPNQMEWTQDHYKSTIIVRINIDPQTVGNGCLRVIPGSYHEGPFEIKGGMAEYVQQHEQDAIDCVGGEGSVTFYYPTMLHASAKNTLAAGTHRRAAAHRVRRASLRIPGWDWPTDWDGARVPAVAEAGFDLNPVA